MWFWSMFIELKDFLCMGWLRVFQSFRMVFQLYVLLIFLLNYVYRIFNFVTRLWDVKRQFKAHFSNLLHQKNPGIDIRQSIHRHFNFGLHLEVLHRHTALQWLIPIFKAIFEICDPKNLRIDIHQPICNLSNFGLYLEAKEAVTRPPGDKNAI